MRHFLVPKVWYGAPVNSFAPKYFIDIATQSLMRYEQVGDGGELFLVRSDADDAALDVIAALPDVEEIANDNKALKGTKRAAVAALMAGKLAAATSKATGAELIAEIAAQCKAVDKLRTIPVDEQADRVARMQAQLDLKG